MPLTAIYKKLLENHQIALIPTNLVTPPYPNWYDLNACCEYHGGLISHSTDNCVWLRNEVDRLIRHDWLKLENEDQSSSTGSGAKWGDDEGTQKTELDVATSVRLVPGHLPLTNRTTVLLLKVFG